MEVRHLTLSHISWVFYFYFYFYLVYVANINEL